MEILTLLRLNAKRLTALATVGALCGAVAAAAVSRQAASYEASTTVFVSQALPEGGSAFDVSPLVADFQKAVTLPQVRQAVADRIQLPLDEITVVSTRNGNDGGSVEVVAVAGNAPDAEAISQSVSTEAMRFLAQREVDRAENIEARRTQDVEDMKTSRDALLESNGWADPTVTYGETLNRLNSLTLDKSDPTKSLTPEQRVAADQEAARLRLQLPQLQALADDYTRAKVELADAESLLKAAKIKRSGAQEVLDAATTDVAISAGETVQASKLATMLQAFVAAVVATFLAGVAFFFAVDGTRKRQPKAATMGATGSPSAASKPAPSATATPNTGGATGAAGSAGAPGGEESGAPNGRSQRVATPSAEQDTLEALEAAIDEHPEKSGIDLRVESSATNDAPRTGQSSSLFANDNKAMLSERSAAGTPVASTSADTADPPTTGRERKSSSNRRKLPGS